MQGPAVHRVPDVGPVGIQGRVRSGRSALVRFVGSNQCGAHGQAVQEVPAARALGRPHGTVPASVQAAQG